MFVWAFYRLLHICDRKTSSWASYQLQRNRLVTRTEVLKTRVRDFIVFKGPPGHLLKKRMQFRPAQNKMYLITQWTVSDTQSCQTLKLIIVGFFISLNTILTDI